MLVAFGRWGFLPPKLRLRIRAHWGAGTGVVFWTGKGDPRKSKAAGTPTPMARAGIS